MITTRILKTAINAAIRSHGFTRKGSTWYLKSDEVIVVLNLQKSNYDATYFLNLGFWLQEIEEAHQPKPECCHVQTRVSALWPDGNPRIADLLRIDDFPYKEEQRISDIKHFISEKLVPVLLEASTIAGVRKLLKQNNDFLIMIVAREILGLEMS